MRHSVKSYENKGDRRHGKNRKICPFFQNTLRGKELTIILSHARFTQKRRDIMKHDTPYHALIFVNFYRKSFANFKCNSSALRKMSKFFQLINYVSNCVIIMKIVKLAINQGWLIFYGEIGPTIITLEVNFWKVIRVKIGLKTQ